VSATPTERVSDDEAIQILLIARHHGLPSEGLLRLISEARTEARNRRRRLPDARLEELVAELGRPS
jgi:hypothetical protein